MQKFRNSMQFASFMKKEASRLGISLRNAYTTYISRVFLEKLSKYNNGLILVKGSAAETSYLGELVRGITDVDLALLGPIEFNTGLLSSFVNDETISDFHFKMVREPKVTSTGIYKMSFEAQFDKTRQPLGVDLQENYNRLIEKQVRMMPAIFEGDHEFPVVVPSFEEYLAEKLCIIAESNKTDVLNTRVKDFYDIYRLHGGKYNPEKLTKYFGQMLKLRGKIDIKDASTIYLDKDFVEKHKDLWEKAKDRFDFLDDGIDLYGAVYYTRGILREELHKNGSEMPHYMVPRQYHK
ncbi:MAG: nucleotidyl transferase AbiEii/AbiGii toxin family protein [Bacilli bacterium]|nr:nucleotidyl transferase AbiEii/AbiGii toxin family protein [Bacilli bacterium]